MTPGDLFRTLRKRLRPEADPCLLRVADASHDHTMAALWYADEEIMKWPTDEVPEHSVFFYVCTHPECADMAWQPFVCHRGDAPQGIERRGLEFLQEPGNCGHTVQRRLVARGADAILGIAGGFRTEQGVRVFR